VLYAGDCNTGRIVWDSDIRPSDATYLAQQTGAPIFVDRSVWQSTQMTHKQLLESKECKADAGEDASGESTTEEPADGQPASIDHNSQAGVMCASYLALLRCNLPRFAAVLDSEACAADTVRLVDLGAVNVTIAPSVYSTLQYVLFAGLRTPSW
jgi:hypothetical protein